MKTLQLEVDVTPDRQLMIQLPEDVELGKHQLVLVLQPQDQAQSIGKGINPLNNLAGKVQSFAKVDAVAWQQQVRDEWNED